MASATVQYKRLALSGRGAWFRLQSSWDQLVGDLQTSASASQPCRHEDSHSCACCRFELLQWQKRRLHGVKKCFMCRLAPQSIEDPLYVVPKAVSEHDWSGLDSRGVFLIQAPGVAPILFPAQTGPC